MKRALLTIPALALLGLVGLVPGLASPDASDGARPDALLEPRPGQDTQKATAGYGQGGERARYGPDADRSKLPDLYKYYGPNGLWYRWDDSQKLGRDTWILYSGGNQKFYRILAEFGGQLDISIDFYRLLDSRRRDARFKELGLINEPNYVGGKQDEYGFWVDQPREGFKDDSYPADPKWYGEPTGIVGLRKFPNPDFTEEMREAWLKDPKASVRRYFEAPGRVEPPHLVGITCALCHIAFDPLNPPADPASPRWENLSANIGNQYFREGDLFFGAGRIVGGDANKIPGEFEKDPYATRGLDEKSFLFQYGHTQQPGTSETSRFSYDFINNPNTINQIFYIGARPQFCETTPTGVKLLTTHILKDGSDSIGLHGALLRVFINIGGEGDYWADRLWNPLSGSQQSPFQIKEAKLQVSDARKAELLAKYPDLGEAWREQERRVPFLASYLASYTPFYLSEIKDEQGRPKYITKDAKQLERGKLLFADHCARCHSNKQPFYPLAGEEDARRFYRNIVLSDDFLAGNTLSDDVRHPFNEPGFEVNGARALATNAIDGDIWADFSSEDYKALPALRTMTFRNPLGRVSPRYGDPIVTEFVAPGGGRGYYRTAALNSMWATAPYLHNNAVGPDPVSKGEDGREYLDAKYVTVEGRLELFERSIQELLSPGERRPVEIKVTSAESSLTEGMPGVRARLAAMLRELAKQRIQEKLEAVVAGFVDDLALPEIDAPLRPIIREAISALLLKFGSELEKAYSEEAIKKIKAAAAESLRQQIAQVIDAKLKDRPKLRALVADLQPKLEATIKEHAEELTDLFEADLVIPAGTPVNLIMNLHVGKVPYALAAYLKHKGDPRKLAEELLRLSDCPDLVENRGHYYGSELTTEEKRDLIEFLKTL